MDKPDKDGEKESIEEILSDLNGLLNRMPAILSDIKMPETRPVDFSRIRREAEDQPAPQAEQVRQDETIRLEPEEMAGIAASAYVLPESEPQPDPEPDLSGEEYNFEFAPEPPAAAVPAPETVPAPVPAPEAADKPRDYFDQSGDFGVPDIDALLQLSAGDIVLNGVSAGDTMRHGVPVPSAQKIKDQGGEMEEKRQDDQVKPAEETPGSLPAGDAVPEQPPAFDATVKMDSPFEFPEPAAEQPEPEAKTPDAQEALPSGDDLKAFESAFVIPGTDDAQEPETPSVEAPEAMAPPFPAPEPVEQPEPAIQETAAPAAEFQSGGISLEPQFSMPEEQSAPAAEQPAEQAAVVEDPQLSVGEPQLSVGAPDQQPGGLSPGPRSDTPFESPIEAITAASSGETAGEKTVVFGPGQGPGTPGGEETLVYQGGDPSATSRTKAGASLPELAAMEPPDTVDKSRVKTLAFMYASGEDKFCADVLATLDAICLKSESRPMFIKRAFVKPCGDDMRGAVAQRLVSEAGAAGLICVGSVAQEALYDIENAFGSSGSFFRHFSQDNFNLTSALDSVLDLILKP